MIQTGGNNMLRELIQEIYNICMEDLDANYRVTDHIDYIMYRLIGGTETEEDWFRLECQ